MTTVFREQFIKNFNIFIEQLKVIFPNDDTMILLNNINDMSDTDKLNSGDRFNGMFNDETFDLFVKSKIKVFSHKEPKTKEISESLFGENFCLKNLLNNQPDDVKKVIWTNLHTLYFMTELQKPSDTINTERVSILSKLLNKKPEPENETTSTPNVTKKLHDILGVDINKETTEMIDEIVGSFEKLMNKSKSSNPIAGIMEISKLISVKYADKINNGEIEIDKLMAAISKKVPGMDKMMDSMMNSMKSEKAKPKETVIIDDNFSTSLVQVGKQAEEESSMKFGNMLKMADQFGVIPGGKKSGPDLSSMMSNIMGGKDIPDGEMPDISSMMNNIMSSMKNDNTDAANSPNMEKIFGFMQKLQSSKTNEEAEDLKKEMDIFMQNELGVDVNQLNEQMDELKTHVKNVDTKPE